MVYFLIGWQLLHPLRKISNPAIDGLSGSSGENPGRVLQSVNEGIVKNSGSFSVVVLLIIVLASSPALAGGKGKLGDVDRALKDDRIEKSLDKCLDAAQINKRFTKELKDLKGNLDKGDIDKEEFDNKAAELQAGFLRDLEDIE